MNKILILLTTTASLYACDRVNLIYDSPPPEPRMFHSLSFGEPLFTAVYGGYSIRTIDMFYASERYGTKKSLAIAFDDVLTKTLRKHFPMLDYQEGDPTQPCVVICETHPWDEDMIDLLDSLNFRFTRITQDVGHDRLIWRRTLRVPVCIPTYLPPRKEHA